MTSLKNEILNTLASSISFLWQGEETASFIHALGNIIITQKGLRNCFDKDDFIM
ncbi:hypothetical protein PCANB_001672 [Pneumocystis canis]|nr:hypothetical protein PCANB_001672 [Pneumocystis canis]